MCCPIASRVEMNGIGNTTAANRKHRIACFVSPFENLEFLSAESEHLRHKLHAVEFTFTVEGRKDFFLAADFHPFACFEFSCDPVHSDFSRLQFSQLLRNKLPTCFNILDFRLLPVPAVATTAARGRR